MAPEVRIVDSQHVHIKAPAYDEVSLREASRHEGMNYLGCCGRDLSSYMTHMDERLWLISFLLP